MKINDPFGRIARRHQSGYESLREVLRRGGIDTPEAAHEVIRKTRARAVKFGAFCLLALLAVMSLFPQATVAAVAVAALALGLVAAWTINGGRYIRRYIDEDLGRAPGRADGDD